MNRNVLQFLKKMTNTIETAIPWVPVDPPLCNHPGERNPRLYERVIEQFDVATNPRYAPRDGKTYCNIFAWDVTRAMSAEIPHWVTPTGEPAKCRERGAQRNNCNAMHAWLHSVGDKYGWRRVDAMDAVIWASRGCPAVAIYYNLNGNGHVGIIRPDSTKDSGPLLAQAGQRSFLRGSLVDSFGSNTPEFWVHE